MCAKVETVRVDVPARMLTEVTVDGGVVGQTVAFLRFEGSVREVYEVVVMPGIRVPEITEVGADLLDGAFVLPTDALADVPEALRS